MNDQRPKPDARLTNLQERYTELERLVEQLNEVLVEHTKALAELQRDNTELRDSVRSLEQKQEEAEEPPPPHY